jgi:hypothetical protein
MLADQADDVGLGFDSGDDVVVIVVEGHGWLLREWPRWSVSCMYERGKTFRPQAAQ